MSVRPRNACGEYPCPNAQPCPVHARRPWQHAQPSAAARGYGWHWTRIREQVLAEEPRCRLCGQRSTTVDHIVSRAQGGSDARGNLRGLCAACHQAKTGRESARARR